MGAARKLRSTPDIVKDVENEKAIGGMRNPLRSLGHVPGHVQVGKDISKILDDLIYERPHITKIVKGSVGVERSKAPVLKDFDIDNYLFGSGRDQFTDAELEDIEARLKKEMLEKKKKRQLSREKKLVNT